MWKKILIVVALLLALAVMGGLTLPDTFQVERSVLVAAPPEQLQPVLEDLMAWKSWAPWELMDTTIVTTMGAITRGVGASQSWTDKNGGGRLEITSCAPGRVEYDVFFADSPTPAHSVMTATPEGEGSRVTWSMSGKADMPVVGPYFSLLADWMIGAMFQQGLDSLAALAKR